MKYLLILLFASFQSTHAQTVTFKEIKLKPKSEFYTTNESTIIYPLAFTNNKPVDKLINDKIKNEMLGEDAVTARKALTEQSSEGLVNMSYKVSFKKYGILSITIYAEGCGAHCSSWNTYFNFDLKTGKTISIYDLVTESRIDSFRKIVSAAKVKALNKYKEEKRNYWGNDIDSVSINWAIEQVDDNCIGNIQLEHFSLSETGIEIMDPCEFPHAIRALEPDYALKYSYKFMLPFVKPKFRSLLSK